MVTAYVPDWPSDRDRLSLQVLATRIRNGNCVLLLGPGAATVDGDAERQPLESLLIAQLLAAIGEPPPEAAAADPGAVAVAPPQPDIAVSLPLTAERWMKALPDRDALSQQVVDFYAAQGQLPTAMHLALARLPFALCISTTFDDQMFQAFTAAGKAPRLDLYWPGQPRPAATAELPSADRPLVYHLFGHPSAPGSMALREGELIRGVAGIVRDQPPLPDVVRSALADTQTSCLFLGFGIHHWHLRLLLEVLQVFNNRTSRQLALEHTRVMSNPGHREAVELTYDEKSLELRPLNGEAFAKALGDAFGRLPPLPTPRPAVATPAQAVAAATTAAPMPLPSGMTQTMPVGGAGPKLPLVFLSYAHEDREAITLLAVALERRNLRVWRDDQNLRTGDNWEERLMSLIKKGVDYVAVVQTPAMLQRTEGVFNQEIAAALARQKLMGYAPDGTPLRFVLSVSLGNVAPLPPLAPFHTIDVGQPDGIDGLAASVLEDWASRTRMRASAKAKAA